MPKMSALYAISKRTQIQDETQKLFEIARYLKDSSKPEFANTIYDLANSKKQELRKIDQKLADVNIEL